MKTIYNVYVPMESQEQCDRMKQLCIDNKIPLFDEYALTIDNDFPFCVFRIFAKRWAGLFPINGTTKVTEQEFIQLLQNERNT